MMGFVRSPQATFFLSSAANGVIRNLTAVIREGAKDGSVTAPGDSEEMAQAFCYLRLEASGMVKMARNTQSFDTAIPAASALPNPSLSAWVPFSAFMRPDASV